MLRSINHDSDTNKGTYGSFWVRKYLLDYFENWYFAKDRECFFDLITITKYIFTIRTPCLLVKMNLLKMWSKENERVWENFLFSIKHTSAKKYSFFFKIKIFKTVFILNNVDTVFFSDLVSCFGSRIWVILSKSV